MTTKTEKPGPRPVEKSPDAPGLKIQGIEDRYEQTATAEAPAAPAAGASPSPSAPARPKIGRPPGSKTRHRTAPAPPQGSERYVMRPMVQAAIAFPYEMAAARYGPHWILTEQETDRMVDAHLALLNKYLPDYVKEHEALYTVVIMHATAIMVRLSIQQQQAREAQASAARAVTETPPDGSNPDPRQAWLGKVGPDAAASGTASAVPAL